MPPEPRDEGGAHVGGRLLSRGGGDVQPAAAQLGFAGLVGVDLQTVVPPE